MKKKIEYIREYEEMNRKAQEAGEACKAEISALHKQEHPDCLNYKNLIFCRENK